MFNLIAAVIDVIFARHIVARPNEELGERIAESADASMAEVDVARGVGGEEFHVDLFAFGRTSSIVFAKAEHFAQDARKRIGMHEEVNEARTGNLHLFNARVSKIFHEFCGEIARIHP